MSKFCTFVASSGGEPGNSPSLRATQHLELIYNIFSIAKSLKLFCKEAIYKI